MKERSDRYGEHLCGTTRDEILSFCNWPMLECVQTYVTYVSHLLDS